MHKLSFLQLTKIFAAGFLGYALLVSFLTLATALLFPAFIKGYPLDMSIHTFFETVFYFFGMLGVIAATLMLAGAWCILRVFRKYDRAA
jgi:hypothetical protein